MKIFLRKSLFLIWFSAVFLYFGSGPILALDAVNKTGEEVITRGAWLEQYNVTVSAGNTKAYVLKIDLKDPFIKINTVYGVQGKLGINQTVQKMAEETGAIAAINGDFFDMAGGSTLGPLIQDGKLITTPGPIEGTSAFALTADGKASILPFTFEGLVTAANGEFFPVASINKTISLADKLNIFDSHWNFSQWPGARLDSYAAVVVVNGRVREILENTRPENIPKEAYVILGHGRGGQFLLDNIKPGEELELGCRVAPPGDWSLVLGAHTPLVEKGQRAVFTRNIPGNHARTAIGYSRDDRFLYWVVAEKSTNSQGMTLEELADLMIFLGVGQGVNLDGGGSTTLVGRRYGDIDVSLVNIPQSGNLRNVPDGLALYSTAPPGKTKDILVRVPSFMLMKETITPHLREIDEYDNPISGESGDVSYKAVNDVISFSNSQLTGQKAGLGRLEIKSPKLTKEITIPVLGRDNIKGIELGTASLFLNLGDTREIKPVIHTKDGQSRQVSANLLKWEWIGKHGSVDSNGIVKAGAEAGLDWLVGTYDRFSAMIPVQVGVVEEVLVDFENNPILNFSGLPKETSGEFRLDETDLVQGKYSGKLSYDFSQSGAEMNIAYGQFNGQGIALPRPASGISLWVKGDNSNYWLRAEVADSSGKINYITLADRVNWTGWKKVSADFPGIFETGTLKRIYLVNQKKSGSQQPDQGSISLDEIAIKTSAPLTGKTGTKLNLYVNKKIMLVNGEQKNIDQGPIIENNRSYVPARFIVEALGGQALWDPALKDRVRLILGTTMMDLWINDQKHTVVNGVNIPVDTAPIIRNNRTLIPVRMVSENLGYQVDWNRGEIIIH